MVNWEDKEEATKALQELYPNMKIFQINMIVDLYKQSLTDEDLSKLIEETGETNELPKITDYEEIDYGTQNAMEIIKKGDYEEWACELCGHQDERKKSEQSPHICQGCYNIYYLEKNEENADNDEK